MKKSLHFVMSVLIMLSIGISGSLYVIYDAAQLHFKIDARKEVASGDRLQTLKLSLSDFNTAKENDEVWHNGKLYDVKSYVIVNDSVLISVLHDEGEEGLVRSIADSFEPNDRCGVDNISHISKHKVHLPLDGKVLVERHRLTGIGAPLCELAVPYYTVAHFSPVYSSVIKPPPRYVVG